MAWSYESLIAARILQAMGGGAIQPIGMAIVAELFEPHERGRALGIWGTGIMAGPAIGPDPGRLPDRRLQLADNLLGQPAVRGADADCRHDHHAAAARPRGEAAVRSGGYSFLAMALVAGLTALVQRAGKRAGIPTTSTSARRSPSWAR
jgi:MFS family permease